MEDEIHEELCQDNLINIQNISKSRKRNKKGEKQSESFPNYFLRYIMAKEGVLSITGTF